MFSCPTPADDGRAPYVRNFEAWLAAAAAAGHSFSIVSFDHTTMVSSAVYEDRYQDDDIAGAVQTDSGSCWLVVAQDRELTAVPGDPPPSTDPGLAPGRPDDPLEGGATDVTRALAGLSAALVDVASMFSAGGSADGLGPCFTCRQADVMARLLVHTGAPAAAINLIYSHAQDDDEDDRHGAIGLVGDDQDRRNEALAYVRNDLMREH